MTAAEGFAHSSGCRSLRQAVKGCRVPNDARSSLWAALLHLYRDDSRQASALVYERLKATWPRVVDLDQVERDLPRTFPLVEEVRGPHGQAVLRRLLWAYSVHDEKVHYVQGMNYVAGALVYYMDEQSAFFALQALMLRRKWRRVFMEGFPGLHEHIRIFGLLLRKHLPATAERLRALEIELVLFSTDWFMTIFTKTFHTRMDIVGALLDNVLLFGTVFVHALGLGVLKMAADIIAGSEDAEEVMHLLMNPGEWITSPVHLVAAAHSFQLSKKDYAKLQQRAR